MTTGAVAQQQGLVDRMGDVDHGLAGLLPDTHQLGLQDDAVLGVERGKGLVHQQHAGSVTKARAIALRWRMPPESWCG